MGESEVDGRPCYKAGVRWVSGTADKGRGVCVCVCWLGEFQVLWGICRDELKTLCC